MLKEEPAKHSTNILVLDPTWIQLLKLQINVDVSNTLSNLYFENINTVFFCVNNCTDGLEGDWVKIWRLLVFCKNKTQQYTMTPPEV